jgi:hypothetical protein
MKTGIKIGPLQVPSVQDLKDESQALDTKIDATNLANKNYESALKKLTTDITTMTNAKKEYLNLVTISTDSEIEKATQTKNYTIEYLWSKIGNHATEEGINLKMDVSASSIGDSAYKNLKFTATGNYLALTNFIYELENDTKLEFTIDNFDMTVGQCTFTVKDIKIINEKTTATLGSSSSNNTTSTSNSNTQTNTNNTKN